MQHQFASSNPDEAVGITIDNLAFRHRVSRKDLGQVLGVNGTSAGRRLTGDIKWTLNDLYDIAEFFEIRVEDLLPQKSADGFEPVIVGQRRLYERPMQDSNLRPAD